MLSQRRMRERKREREGAWERGKERRRKENLKSFKSGVNIGTIGRKMYIEQLYYLEKILEFEDQL